jgi:isoamylase
MSDAHHERLIFKLPGAEYGKQGVKILHTRETPLQEEDPVYEAGAEIEVEVRSLNVFRRRS